MKMKYEEQGQSGDQRDTGSRSETSSDLDLLRRWRSGDGRAGNRLINRHYRWVSKKIRKDMNEPDDVAQRVFLVLLQYDEKISNVRGFISKVIRNKVAEHWRQKRLWLGSSESTSVSKLLEPGNGAFTLLAKGEDTRLLVKALQMLDVEKQAYLMWHYADRLSFPEIADRIGLRTPQVNGFVRRAREQLRSNLEELRRLPPQRKASRKGFDTWVLSLRQKLVPDEGA